MIRQLAAISTKELKVFFKDPTGLSLNFVMPLAFILVMSFALAGTFGSNNSERPLTVLIVNNDEGPRAAAVISELQSEANIVTETAMNGVTLTEQIAEQAIIDRQHSLALIFPSNYSSAIDQPLNADPQISSTVRVIADPGASRQFIEPVVAALQGLVAQANAEAMPDKITNELVNSLLANAPADQREAARQEARDSINIDDASVTVVRVTPAGMTAEQRPNSFQQNVPGYTVFGVFWIVQQLALSVVRERRDGTLRRLLAAPLSKGALLMGKLVPFYFINLLQIILMLGIVGYFFGLNIGGSPAGMIAVSLALAFAATSMGVLVAAFGKSESQVIGLTTLLLILMAAIGGSFVPVFLMPDWMQTASLITPHGWALQAYVDLIVRGYGLMEVMQSVVVLLAFGLVFLVIGVWRFKFD